MVNTLYLQVVLLFQSEETSNFRLGREYIILRNPTMLENIMWYDGTPMWVRVALDRVNGRLFGLYKVSLTDLLLRWLPEIVLATFQTLDPKVYGIMAKKEQGDVYLFLRLPEQGKESLRMCLSRRNEDMNIIRDLTARLFAEIARYHRAGVANLGITEDAVSVISGGFLRVVLGSLSHAMFRGFAPGFEEAKLRDVERAKSIILTYLSRLPSRCPLCWVLLTPNCTAINILSRIHLLKPTQEVSYDLATDGPGFFMSDDPQRFLSGPQQLALTSCDQNARGTGSPTQPISPHMRVRESGENVGTREEERWEQRRQRQSALPESALQAEDIRSVNPVSSPSKNTSSKCLTANLPVVESKGFPQTPVAEELTDISEQGSSGGAAAISNSEQRELISDEAVDISADLEDLKTEDVPVTISIPRQVTLADSGVGADMAGDDDDDDGHPPD
ncbi:uncharacterized protein LOC135480744 isoform X2 [Liolophura sinensis]